MKNITAIALATSLLLVAALPAAAFDTDEWTTRSFDWKAVNQRITQPMTNVKKVTTRLFNTTDTYLLYLRAVEDDASTCQSDAGFDQHQEQVKTYLLDLLDANMAARDGHVRRAKRLVGVAAESFAIANGSRAVIQSRCG